MKLVVVSICKDEESTIGDVLDGVPAKVPGVSGIEKWVIDDGSTDGTVKVAKKHGAQVLSDGVNKRLAYRFREAVDLALSRNADIMVNIDGDLQFNPSDIPIIIDPIIQETADFVAADRFTSPEDSLPHRPKNMSGGKYYGNKLGSWVTSKLSQHKFNDVTCGFRAYNRRAMIALNINNSYTYTQESFQIMAMKKMRIVAVPVAVKYYPDRKSRVVTSIPKYVALSALNILRLYRDFAPLRFFGWFGFVPFMLGLICLVGFTGHWIATGSFSPYKFLGFAGAYFMTLAIFFWALGLVADMLSRMLNNQEKILELLKEERYKK